MGLLDASFCTTSASFHTLNAASTYSGLSLAASSIDEYGRGRTVPAVVAGVAASARGGAASVTPTATPSGRSAEPSSPGNCSR